MAHAAGVIVLHGFSSDDINATKVLLVETKAPGNWGFPKGSHEKGEVWTQTAFRELNEESGLQADQIQCLGPYEEKSLIERNAKGNVGVQYLVAQLSVPLADITLKPDNPEEVLSLEWCLVKEAKQKLVAKRRKVLMEALKLLRDSQT